ncbi:MAG: MTH1187 family thiamine-binding protein [Nitrospirae bacterium]|nr:MTH1187 family thiamine-binding protein [Nitrospirota bacterium]
MALLEMSVVPIGTSTPSIGDYIADVVLACNKAKVKYKLTDMGTIIEGRPGDLFKLAQKLHETPFKKGIKRVLTNLSIDDRRDKRVRLDDKVGSVMARLEK